ncbi:facilitated trehalose transporter Tret1 [Diabrotica virgifera virgifera]|uniref:Facilitated trehalose transporter Tret1-like n=1 Tax=Diabrotica virgifera virgifera TaxID=50390 RepID=A0A6P7FZR0_DIAVI|nr:facilitated trehalose transporter Tret1 [Diabrotica virgifera virgifera]XP_028140277.1 facilitated trehalose transporter Tret1 [Diabrotica virgifera virgifera]XP_028140278.1 facilitated trehalose transporter Tret1 [Diabrotica virgifera virgifera]
MDNKPVASNDESYTEDENAMMEKNFSIENLPLKIEIEQKKPDTFFLLFMVIAGSMTNAVSGAHLVWTSPVVPKLKSDISDDNPIGRPATTLEISMIAGFAPLAMIGGSLVLGTLSELLGRKRSLQLLAVGIFLANAVLAFSNNIVLIIVSRSILFFFFNGTMTIYPVYLTEICEDHNRAKYGCLMGVFLPFGSLLSYALGSFFSVRIYTLLLSGPLILFLAFFFLAPESPVYSLSKGRRNECLQTLMKLRSNKTEKEIMVDMYKIEETIRAKDSGTSANSMASVFSTKERRYALMLALIPVAMQPLSGVLVTLQFLAPLFIAAGSKYDSNHMSIIVGSIELSSFLLTTCIIERTGRKPMLLISSIGIGITHFVLGLYFYLKYIECSFISSIHLLPLACVINLILMYSLGLGPIPMAIMGELFTPDIRTKALSLIMTVLGIGSFATTSSYPFMVEYLGMHWCVWINSLCCIAGATFIYVMIPETKGKSIVQIQEYIKTKCNK